MLTNLTESSQEQDAQWTFSNGEVFLLCLVSYALPQQPCQLGGKLLACVWVYHRRTASESTPSMGLDPACSGYRRVW
jgi:hypothetical protein